MVRSLCFLCLAAVETGFAGCSVSATSVPVGMTTLAVAYSAVCLRAVYLIISLSIYYLRIKAYFDRNRRIIIHHEIPRFLLTLKRYLILNIIVIAAILSLFLFTFSTTLNFSLILKFPIKQIDSLI